MKKRPTLRPAAIFQQIDQIGKYFADRSTHFDIGVIRDAQNKLQDAAALVQIRYLDLVFDEEISA
jgi:hypothetical protein